MAGVFTFFFICSMSNLSAQTVVFSNDTDCPASLFVRGMDASCTQVDQSEQIELQNNSSYTFDIADLPWVGGGSDVVQLGVAFVTLGEDLLCNHAFSPIIPLNNCPDFSFEDAYVVVGPTCAYPINEACTEEQVGCCDNAYFRVGWDYNIDLDQYAIKIEVQ